MSDKFVRVHLTLDYIVPADRQDMIDEAHNAIEEDLIGLIKDGSMAVAVEDAPNATYADVPDFIRDLCDERDSVLGDSEEIYGGVLGADGAVYSDADSGL
jgi:hypothetical protein